jgi:hypothetical protein
MVRHDPLARKNKKPNPVATTKFSIRLNGFPRHRRKNVDVEPDNSEQQEIDEAKAECLPHFSRMRHERDRGHKRDGVEKEEQIGGERRGALIVQAELGVNQHQHSG